MAHTLSRPHNTKTNQATQISKLYNPYSISGYIQGKNIARHTSSEEFKVLGLEGQFHDSQQCKAQPRIESNGTIR